MSATTTKRAVIENPFCKVHSAGVCAGFTFRGDRYHVWLNREGTATANKNGRSILYKRPAPHIEKHQPGYYQCKHLDATAKANAALIAELLASIDPEKAWADYRAEQAAEESRLKAEAKARADRERLEGAAPDLFLACERASAALRGLKNQCDEREWREDWQDLPEALEMLEAALKKAKGQS